MYIKQKLKNIINFLKLKFFFNLTKEHGGRQIVHNNGIVLFHSKNNFLSLSLRPKYSKDISLVSKYKSHNNEFALILQGPIIEKNNFTIETIKLYKRLFPGAVIILSTWRDISNKLINKIEKMKIKLILNDYPPNPGWGNINYQVTSTKSALFYASQNNIEFSMKTRTDWRLYNNDIIPFLISMVNTFPSLSSIKNQEKRIVASEMMTCKHRVYGLTDTFHFGTTNDLISYWDVDEWEKELETHFGGEIIKDNTPLVCEIFLCAMYLKKMGLDLDWTLESWWDALKKYFIIINSDDLDLFWYKYDYNFEQRFRRSYVSHSHRTISFKDWIAIYNGLIHDWSTSDKLKEKWQINNSGELIQIIK